MDPVLMRGRLSRGYLARIHEGFRARTLFQWGIERKEDSRIIGTTTLFSLDTGNARAEIGYVPQVSFAAGVSGLLDWARKGE